MGELPGRDTVSGISKESKPVARIAAKSGWPSSTP